MNEPLVVSFFTKNTPYEKEAVDFITTCKKHGVDYEVEALDSRGAWDLNCALKPGFLLKKLKEKKRPLLWVDIDGRFLRPLETYDWNSLDLSLRVNAHLPEDDPCVFYSATLYCSYQPQTLLLIEDWMQQCEEDLAKSSRTVEVWDQQVLQNVLSRHLSVRFQPLPWKFAKIFDADSSILSSEETIIEHTQASRRLRKYVCEEDMARYRFEKIEEMLDIIDGIEMTFLIEVDDTTLMDIGTCLYHLAPFHKKTYILGKFQHFDNFQRFSQIAKIYPLVPFILDEEQAKKGRSVLRLRANQCLDSSKLFFWLLEKRGEEFFGSLDTLPFLEVLKKKVVNLSKHPFLAL
jgi:hypothetical protein